MGGLASFELAARHCQCLHCPYVTAASVPERETEISDLQRAFVRGEMVGHLRSAHPGMKFDFNILWDSVKVPGG